MRVGIRDANIMRDGGGVYMDPRAVLTFCIAPPPFPMNA